MKKNPSFKTLAFVISILCMSALVLISDIVYGNLFGVTMCLALIVTLCFVLGYVYSKFEKWNSENGISFKLFERKEPKEKKQKQEEEDFLVPNVSIDDLLEMAEKANSAEKSEQDIDKTEEV